MYAVLADLLKSAANCVYILAQMAVVEGFAAIECVWIAARNLREQLMFDDDRHEPAKPALANSLTKCSAILMQTYRRLAICSCWKLLAHLI